MWSSAVLDTFLKNVSAQFWNYVEKDKFLVSYVAYKSNFCTFIG